MKMSAFCDQVIEDFDKSGELSSRVYVISDDGLFMHFQYPGDDPEKTHQMRYVVIKIITALRVTGTLSGAALIGEAWTSTIKVGETRKYERCEDDPNRGELVFYFSYEADGSKTCKSWTIARDGGKVSRKEYNDYHAGIHSGWLDKAFQPLENPSAGVIYGAREFLKTLRTKKGGL